MKKILSLVLALAMALSLGAVAFAYNSNLIEEEPDHIAIGDMAENTIFKIWDGYPVMYYGTEFGEKYYFLPLEDTTVGTSSYGDWITPAWQNMKSASGVKVTAQWDQGGEYVESVNLVRKHIDVISESDIWLVELSIRDYATTESVDLAGKIYLKGTTGSGDNKEKIDKYFTVDLTLEFPDLTTAFAGEKKAYIQELTPKKDGTRWIDRYVIDLEDITRDDYTFSVCGRDDEEDMSIEADVSGTKKLLVAYNRDVIDEVAAAYPNANLDYYNLTLTLRKSGEAELYADAGTYLYKYEDGKLTKVDAEYDEFEEAFTFTAKKFGSYVVSDVELDTSLLGAATVAPVDGAAATNPSTGAAL